MKLSQADPEGNSSNNKNNNKFYTEEEEKKLDTKDQTNLWKYITENEFSQLRNVCNGFVWKKGPKLISLLAFLCLFIDDKIIHLFIN